MNKLNLLDFVVVIRSSGERTVEACKIIVDQEIPEENVNVIECKPFEAALRECYKIGINSKKKWMITIDGDVLPKSGFANQVAKLSESVKDNVIMFNAIIHDKLLMNYRSGGVKVYRTKILPEAIKMIPEDGASLRPEATTLNYMAEKGYKKKNFNYVIGLHDYEQYYKDVYRTAYFHATKHKEKVLDLFEDWKIASDTDKDYVVAIKGAMDGFLSKGETKSDVRFFEEMSEKAIDELGFKEKTNINLNMISKKVESELESAGTFYRTFEMEGIKQVLSKRGFVGGALWYTGSVLEIVGKKIKNRA